MELSELATKPKLIELKIADAEIVEKYGDELKFWIYDRQPLDVFSKLASAKQEEIHKYLDIVRDLILDKEGNPVMTDENVLPLDVLGKAVELISEHLGK